MTTQHVRVVCRQLHRLAVRPRSRERPHADDEGQIACLEDPGDLEIERALHADEGRQRFTDARQAVGEGPGLGRERGTGLIEGQERVEVARVDSVNDRFEDLFRRALALQRGDLGDLCIHVVSSMRLSASTWRMCHDPGPCYRVAGKPAPRRDPEAHVPYCGGRSVGQLTAGRPSAARFWSSAARHSCRWMLSANSTDVPIESYAVR